MASAKSNEEVVAETDDQEELTRLLEEMRPDEEELAKLLEEMRPDPDELTRLLEEMRPDEAELASLFEQLRADGEEALARLAEYNSDAETKAALRRLSAQAIDWGSWTRLDDTSAAPPIEKVDASAADVAKWMVERFQEKQGLPQWWAANEIRRRFNGEHTYKNKNGNWAISADVLAAFAALTPDAVWVRSRFTWRKRQPGDPPGRMVK